MRSSGIVLDLRNPSPHGPAPGNIKDWSRYNHTLTPNGTDLTGWTWDSEISKWVLELNGTDDYISNISCLIDLRYDHTGLIWAYFSGDYSGTSKHDLIELRYNANNFLYFRKLIGGRWSIAVIGGGTTESVTFDDSTKANKWTLFGWAKRGSDLELILDGEIVQTESAASDMDDVISRISIGARYNGSNPWLGKVAEARIYDHALPEGKILRIYRDQSRRYR